jgi:DNA mismatch repair protein MutL
MVALNPKISPDPPVIRQLDEAAANRIAAGEVVERPASAVKELVENALDAGARRVMVAIADGGKTLIRVSDDGHGMRGDDLLLALSRHATSKIDGSDLLNIHSFGFRGEALPSLGAVGRLTITTRAAGGEGAEITVAGGAPGAVRPAARGPGTQVELRDLFHATPARLKFLRSDRAETQAVVDTLKRLALAVPGVGFHLADLSGNDTRDLLRLDPETGTDALRKRARAVIGRAFVENALDIDAQREGYHLSGLAALPSYARGAAVEQFLFVNGRPVRDKMLLGALRAAYADVLARDRHPAAVLFVACDPVLVDVNVHPAKAEVRFRDPALVRGLIVSGLRHALAQAGHRSASTLVEAALGMATTEPVAPRVYQMELRPSAGARGTSFAAQSPQGFAEAPARFAPVDPDPTPQDLPLGHARAQMHETFILAQTRDGLVIVDQHAAHERLVYERLKRQRAETGVTAQALLIPEIVTLSPSDADRVLAVAGDLSALGLIVEPFGGAAIAVRATPALLGAVDAAALLRDVLDELIDAGQAEGLAARIDAILSRMACHGSVRSGRRMRIEEMDALLREIEATPHSGTCNHGRPTWVALGLTDIEKLFGRR